MIGPADQDQVGAPTEIRRKYPRRSLPSGGWRCIKCLPLSLIIEITREAFNFYWGA